MKATERIILCLSVLLNLLLLAWMITLQDRIYETRETLVKFESQMVEFMHNTTQSINYHSSAIRHLAGQP